jgi:hypothetical protein
MQRPASPANSGPLPKRAARHSQNDLVRPEARKQRHGATKVRLAHERLQLCLVQLQAKHFACVCVLFVCCGNVVVLWSKLAQVKIFRGDRKSKSL